MDWSGSRCIRGRTVVYKMSVRNIVKHSKTCVSLAVKNIRSAAFRICLFDILPPPRFVRHPGHPTLFLPCLSPCTYTYQPMEEKPFMTTELFPTIKGSSYLKNSENIRGAFRGIVKIGYFKSFPWYILPTILTHMSLIEVVYHGSFNVRFKRKFLSTNIAEMLADIG